MSEALLENVRGKFDFLIMSNAEAIEHWATSGDDQVMSVAYRGGGCLNFPSSEIPKALQTQPDCEKC